MTFNLKSKLYPSTAQTSKTATVLDTTGKVSMRARGRSFQAAYSSNTVDMGWRLGTWRMQAQQDGLR